MADDLMTAYKKVRDRIQALGAPYDAPPHAIWRITVALGEEAVEFVDANVIADGRNSSGSIIVFTPSRVILVTLVGSPTRPREEERTFSVKVQTWARSSLRLVEMLPNKGEWRNSDEGWSDLMQRGGRPVDFAVTLHYDGRPEPITLPFQAQYRQGERIQSVLDYLPEILSDMSAS